MIKCDTCEHYCTNGELNCNKYKVEFDNGYQAQNFAEVNCKEIDINNFENNIKSMNTPFLTLPPDALRKAGIKLLLVLLGGVATFLETDLLNILELDGAILLIMLGLNTAVVDIIRKYIADEEGKLGGIQIA